MEVKLETTGREVIKPSSPAPHDRLQLSLLDLSCPAIYIATTFFYSSIAGESPEIISRRLKNSLSETLSRFYPLAGRQEGISISCNDEGVIFTEARTDLLLSGVGSFIVLRRKIVQNFNRSEALVVVNNGASEIDMSPFDRP